MPTSDDAHRDGAHREMIPLGINIKLVRIKKGLSAKGLADAIGVSPSLISKIERNHANPSAELLRRIAVALHVSLADLITAGDGQSEEPRKLPARPSVFVVRADERKLLHVPRSGVIYQLLTPDMRRSFEFVMIEQQPGEGGDRLIAHESGEESILVLKGSLTIVIGAESYVINPGDCLTFDATQPHRYRNAGPETAIWIYVAVPPTL
jgi:transcriptional regulator with XRE-family HTH domain